MLAALGRSGDSIPAAAAAALALAPSSAGAAGPAAAKTDGTRGPLSVSEVLARGGVLELSTGLQPALLLSTIATGLLPGGTLPPQEMPASDHGLGHGAGADPAPAAEEAGAEKGADVAEEELPAPEGAGLIAEALPADGRSLHLAIERFLDRLTEISPGEADFAAPPRGGPISVGVLGILAMTLAARHRLGGKRTGASRRQAARDSDQVLEFPELPGSWSTRHT
jgi:hypothetical protein